MKCPQCGYENREDALSCNMCRAVLRREKKTPPPPPAPAASSGEPKTLDSPASVKALLEHVRRVGKEAVKPGNEGLLKEEVPRLASRFFLELSPEECRTLVLGPMADDWLQIAVPAILSPDKNAKARASLDAMLEAAAAKRFGEALEHLKAADAVPGKHRFFELLVLGLGLRRASEKTEPRKAKPAPALPPPPPPARRAPIQKGDVLKEKYEIHGVLGEGGFGIVYLAYHRPSDTVMALKTFREEYFADQQTRDLFRKEAQILVDLDPHPHLVRAYLVDEIHGRLFIALEFIAPDQDRLNTLEGHLRWRPPNLAQSLRWAVQFCHGMEFAESRGLRCHRDIKPANIMIDGRGRLLISDFGLAGALTRNVTAARGAGVSGQDGRTAAGVSFGTPTHMPPEQFLGADRCDHRSDIYSFGVVLFQMAAQGRVPFLSNDRGNFWDGMFRLHAEAKVEPLDSPLAPIIERCLQKHPLQRYQRFAELRQHLETLLRKTTGEAATAPEVKAREDADWDAKGTSLMALGRHKEAMACFDKALALAQTHQPWNNKGVAHMRLSSWTEAIECFDRSLELKDDPHAWVNKSGALLRLGRNEDALAAAEAALERDPRSCGAWANKGACLHALDRPQEACDALDRALEISKTSEEAWATKVAVLQKLGRHDAALAAVDECLSINPGYATGWTNKGYCLSALSRHEEALSCFDRALSLDPEIVNAWAGKRTACKALGRSAEASAALDRELELSPTHGPTWLDKGREHIEAKRWEEALACMEKAVQFEPDWPMAWTNHGLCLMKLDRLDEAQAAYAKALALNPAFGTAALTRGDILRKLERYEEALGCFETAIANLPATNSAASLGAAWFYKGDCLHRLKRMTEAEACYTQALDLLPETARPQVASAAEACRKSLPPPA